MCTSPPDPAVDRRVWLELSLADRRHRRWTVHLQTNLVVARCTDADCANADRSLVKVDPNERVSWDPSLVLDAAGLPVIADVGYGYEQLKLPRCDDAACLAANGDLDRDGIADADDNCALQVNPDQSDPDADGDGQSDADEATCGSNPIDLNSRSADADGDGVPDCADTPMDTLPPTGTTSALLMCSAIVLVLTGEVLRRISAAPRSRRPSVR